MAKDRKPRGRPPAVRGRAADPDSGWNAKESAGDWREAAEHAGKIWKKIEDADGDTWDRAFSFFEDVQQKVLEVQETIQKSQSVSDNQLRALTNWEEGVDKWLKNEE